MSDAMMTAATQTIFDVENGVTLMMKTLNICRHRFMASSRSKTYLRAQILYEILIKVCVELNRKHFADAYKEVRKVSCICLHKTLCRTITKNELKIMLRDWENCLYTLKQLSDAK